MVKHSLICFYFCWASSLLSPSTAFQASHLAPPLVFKTLMRSPKVYKRFLMIWLIKTFGNGTHFRSSIPGFSMFTSPTVAWKIILTFASFHLFSWRKHPKSFHLLVKPVNLFQLLISESFVDFFAHGVRCLVKLLLESHDDQLQTLDTVGQGVGGLNGLNCFFF